MREDFFAHRRGVAATLEALDKQQFLRRLWEKDASLWKREPEHQRIIANRLGWLTATAAMIEQCHDLIAFAHRVRKAGFTHALILGMGGSSLCPEVCRLTYGIAPGYPDLAVLDSTDPATIASVESARDLTRTLYIVSSKSGTTTETLSLYTYFFEKVRALKGDRAGENFIAITDPGTPLERIARENNFLRCFLNPVDIGGRFSALSYFGLVPAAIMGIDIKALLDRADRMAHSCASGIPPRNNPGLKLGVMLAELYREGRDKITLVLSPPLSAFGSWVEQLLAESTGKDGKGLVPVEGKPLGNPAVYGRDRLFVYLRLHSSPDDALDRKVRAVEQSGHPALRLVLSDPLDLGQEFFRWEMATAVAGALLGVNTFDEPNVQESKDNTKALLEKYRTTGQLPQEHPALQEGPIRLYGETGRDKNTSLNRCLAAFLSQARPGDYLSVMAYLQRSPSHHEILQSIRLHLRDTLRIATTLDYGPRFLHSTGQLHKGGPGNGLFMQITADDDRDIAIPGESHTFGILKQAQALGDLLALRNKGRRVIRVHLGGNAQTGLQRLRNHVEEAVRALGR